MKLRKFLPLLAIPFLLIGCNEETAYPFKLGLGGPDVPVGQYSSQILEHFGIDEASLNERGYISYGSNVKEVTSQVKKGLVHAGMIYATDAFSAKLKVVDHATSEMCDEVIYPVAILKRSTQQTAASAFLSYMRSTVAMEKYEAVGFTGLNKLENYEEAPAGERTLTVFAAASMTESLNAVIASYKSVASNIKVIANYESSGTLLKQLNNGAYCDIFLSAAQKQMNTLDTAEQLVEGTRVNILQNQVVLSVPDQNPSKINSFEDLVAKLNSLK